MKTAIQRYVIVCVVCAGIFVSQSAVAQFYTQDFGGGIGVGAFLGHTQMDYQTKDKRSELQVRAYIRHRIFDHLQGELGAGLGQLEGNKNGYHTYRMEIIPIDYRLLWSPFSSETWNPYIYGGGGVLRGDVKDVPTTKDLGADSSNFVLADLRSGKLFKGWTTFFPVGVGLQIKLNDYASLDISGGLNMTLIDNLVVKNKTGRKDQFFSFLVSLGTAGVSQDADLDTDGLSNREEDQLGTDPRNPDTDGDGIFDGDEVNKYKTSPLKTDSDGDNVKDGDEVNMYHTDPNNPDSDEDGLTDGQEVLIYHSDPQKNDTDGDSISDANEVKKFHTDPTKVDTDSDALSDADEIVKYHTDPLKSDTDGDGLSDSDEILKYHSDALKADADSDGLSDGEEVTKHHTDPMKKDSDGGSIDDGAEVARGSNPTDATDDVPKKPTFSVEVGQKIVLAGVVFKSGKAEISPQSETILEKAFNTLNAFSEIQVEIQGHTDDKGKREKNLKLSQDRADAVKAYLVRKGVDPDRIATKGFGPDKPIVPNTTAEGRQTNRRIEFVRIK